MRALADDQHRLLHTSLVADLDMALRILPCLLDMQTVQVAS